MRSAKVGPAPTNDTWTSSQPSRQSSYILGLVVLQSIPELLQVVPPQEHDTLFSADPSVILQGALLARLLAATLNISKA
jgi:hypothetical protein